MFHRIVRILTTESKIRLWQDAEEAEKAEREDVGEGIIPSPFLAVAVLEAEPEREPVPEFHSAHQKSS